jgi:uncharacterized protein YndB with AHSA1/START domain
MRRKSIAVELEVEIERPVDEVWAFVSDVTRLPEWVGEFERVVIESGAPVGKGTVFRYTVLPGHRSSTMELVEWEPGRRFAWDGPPLPWAGGGGRPRGWFEVHRAGEDRTRLVTHFEPELTGTMALMSPYLRRWLRKQRTQDTERLKRLLENA